MLLDRWRVNGAGGGCEKQQSGGRNSQKRRQRKPNQLVTLFILLLAVVPQGLLAQPENKVGTAKDDGYAVIVDAGSSGCRVHVFKLEWDKSGVSKIPHVHLPDHKLKVKPGLSSFKDNPSAAGPSLEGIMKFAMDNIPKEYHSQTPVRLAATAGLRMIPAEAANQILDSCYQYISSHTPFIVKREKVAVISGRDEGAFGWASVNYLYKRLKGMANEKLGTVGTIEMGGASTQITAQLLQPPADAPTKPWAYMLSLAGASYPLYTHSYLGYGQDAARAKYNELLPTSEDPCFPKNYSKTVPSGNPYDGKDGVRGTGNYTACRRRIESEMFPRAMCQEEPCSFGGVHQPAIWPATPSAGGFVMFENFFHSSRAVGVIGMESGVGVPDFERAGEEYCRRKWDEIVKRTQTGLYPAMQTGDETKYCFSMAFFAAFLGKGLGVPAGSKFPVVGSIDGVDIDWSLGMMLAEVLPSQPAQPPSPSPNLPPAAADPLAPAPPAPSAAALPPIALTKPDAPAAQPDPIAPVPAKQPEVPAVAEPAKASVPEKPTVQAPAAEKPAEKRAEQAGEKEAAPPVVGQGLGEVEMNKPLANHPASAYAIPAANVSKIVLRTGASGASGSGGDKAMGSKIELVVHAPAAAPPAPEPKKAAEWGGGEEEKGEQEEDKKADASASELAKGQAEPAPPVQDLVPNVPDEVKKAKDRQQQLQNEFVGPPVIGTTAAAAAGSGAEFKVGGSERSLLGRALGLVGGASVLALVAGMVLLGMRRGGGTPPSPGRAPRALSGTRLSGLSDLEEGKRPLERYRDKDH